MFNAPPNQEFVAVGLQMIRASLENPAERRMIERWRKEYESYYARRARPRRQILEAISEGYDGLAEITAHTNIPYSTARRILLGLVKDLRVKSVKFTNPGNGNRNEFRFEIASGETSPFS